MNAGMCVTDGLNEQPFNHDAIEDVRFLKKVYSVCKSTMLCSDSKVSNENVKRL